MSKINKISSKILNAKNCMFIYYLIDNNYLF